MAATAAKDMPIAKLMAMRGAGAASPSRASSPGAGAICPRVQQCTGTTSPCHHAGPAAHGARAHHGRLSSLAASSHLFTSPSLSSESERPESLSTRSITYTAAK